MKAPKILLVTVFLIGLTIEPGYAQTDSAQKFNVATFLGRSFNPGISAGLGGAHANYFLPKASIRMGRLGLSGSFYDPISKRDIYSYQAELELFPVISKKPFWDDTYISFSGGKTHCDFFTEYGRNTTEILLVNAGLNKYLNSRSKISVKVGPMLHWINNDLKPLPQPPPNPNPLVITTTITSQEKEVSRYLPYAEISYTLYAFQIKPKQKFHVTSKVDETATKEVSFSEYKRERRETMPPKYPGFSRWFNPFWSAGIGLDRAYLVVPSGGLKIDRLNISASGFPEYIGGSLAANVNLDVFRLKPSEKYSKFICLGATGLGLSGDASGSEVYAGIVGMNSYKMHGRTSFHAYVGLGRWMRHSTQFDYSPEPEDPIYYRDSGFMPVVGVSLQIHVLRFAQP